MKIARSIKISRKQLLAHKMRTVLALAGIIIGVSAVIIMVSIGYGAQHNVLSRIEAMGTHLIIVNAAPVRRAAGRMQVRGTVTTLRVEDAEALESSSALIVYAVPVQSRRMQAVSGAYNTQTAITGTSADFPYTRNFRAENGTFFSDEENRASRRVAVLGKTVVKNLFNGSDPVGETIRIGRVPFEVIGVMEAKGVDLNGVDQDDQIFIPINTALRRVFNLNYIESISVQVSAREHMQTAENHIRDVLRERHRLNRRNMEDDFTLQSQTALLETRREAAGAFTTLITSIAAISLLVGGIGILAVMLIAIKERINEIGLRMAVGASRKEISIQFIIESAILSICGGISGILAGIAGSVIISLFTELPARLSVVSILYSFGFSMLTGLFFGVYPAHRASLMDPIEALRSE